MIKRYILMLLQRVMIRTIIPLQKRAFITCSNRCDGIGAQVHGIYSSILYATTIQKKFLYTPLKYVAHNYDNQDDWVTQIEDFFNFKSFNTISSIEPYIYIYKRINLDSITSIIGYSRFLFSSEKILFQKAHFHEYGNMYPQKYNNIKPYLRDVFFSKKSTYLPCNKENKPKDILTISYHIRRGDVNQNVHPYRFTSNKAVINNLQNFISYLKRQNVVFEIHIYSQGDENDFEGISELGKLHLNESPCETFYNLVVSDVLFMAKSSFSYSAALLSNGVIFYEPFWHPPLPEWHILSDDLSSYDKVQKSLKRFLPNVMPHLNNEI